MSAVVPVIFNNCLAGDRREIADRLLDLACAIETGERSARAVVVVIEDEEGLIEVPRCFSTGRTTYAETVGRLEFAKASIIRACRD